jgi:hypothetical protein
VRAPLLLLVASALALACDSAEGPIAGRACADFLECGGRASSACIATWPEGYCTELECTPGSCETGARCARGIMFPGVSIENFCLAVCATKTDCREGYACVDIGEAEDVCAPENPR